MIRIDIADRTLMLELGSFSILQALISCGWPCN